ncbi:hypothetical protein AHiyo6_15520 [Arthrobacter sp. Hiyo6]|jgi:hypothetical protein|nr:hypothetical protein AHiyo6_15520 [Arthrobacter sp. Hiyo6]
MGLHGAGCAVHGEQPLGGLKTVRRPFVLDGFWAATLEAEPGARAGQDVST